MIVGCVLIPYRVVCRKKSCFETAKREEPTTYIHHFITKDGIMRDLDRICSVCHTRLLFTARSYLI